MTQFPNSADVWKANEPAAVDHISSMLTEPFDMALIETRNSMAYVSHEHYRDIVIRATDNQFDWLPHSIEFRQDGVVRRAPDRETGELPNPMVMVFVGILTIPGLGSRLGVGTHVLDAGAGEDAGYKSAESDAFKRACMSFGLGLRQLYIDRVGGGTRDSANDGPPVDRGRRAAAPEAAAASPAVQEPTRDRSTSQDPTPPPAAPPAQQSSSGSSGGNRATPKQIKFIEDLLRKIDQDPADFSLEGDSEFPPITFNEASAWITSLKEGRLPAGVSDPKA